MRVRSFKSHLLMLQQLNGGPASIYSLYSFFRWRGICPPKLDFLVKMFCKNKPPKRNISWFNPPYSSNVKTNVGMKFFMVLLHTSEKATKHRYAENINRLICIVLFIHAWIILSKRKTFWEIALTGLGFFWVVAAQNKYLPIKNSRIQLLHNGFKCTFLNNVRMLSK